MNDEFFDADQFHNELVKEIAVSVKLIRVHKT
jgi:hypothetical protein